MSANIKTILIIGATSGLGEEFARRLHALGKKVIVTGRRQERLSSLTSDLGGSNVAAYQWDITDFKTLSSRSKQILAEHPDIDSVFLMAGLGTAFNYLVESSSKESEIIAECNTNVTAPILLARVFLPHLASIAATGQPANLFLMGSGLGFVPVNFVPSYSATKAAIHSLALSLRQQVNKAEEPVKKYLSVVEVVAPFVDTEFAAPFKSPHGPQPMSVKDYMDETLAALAKTGEDGKIAPEVAAGSAAPRVKLWRDSIGQHMNQIGLTC